MENSVLLGRDLNAQQSVRISDISRRLSLYVIGTPGTGKSTLLERLAIQDMHHGDGLCFLDPHEDSARNLLRWVPDHRKDDVIFWNPTDKERPMGLNPFSCPNPDEVDSRAGNFLAALSSLAEFTDAFRSAPRMRIVLEHLAITFLMNQSYSLAEAPAFLDFTRKAFRACFYPALDEAYPQVREFWERLEDRGRNTWQEWTDSSLNKLERFQLNRTMKTIFGQPTNSIDFRAAMDAGKIIIVPLSSSPKKLGASNAGLLGAFIVWELFQAALSRSELDTASRRPFHLYADEFQTFMSTTFPDIIDQGRKYSLDCVLAHQNRQGQLSEAAKASTLGIKNKIIFTINSQDAHELARSFDTTPEPGEPKLEPVTEPIMEKYTVSYWNPPEAEAEYHQLAMQLFDVSVDAAILSYCFWGEKGNFSQLYEVLGYLDRYSDYQKPFIPDENEAVKCVPELSLLPRGAEKDFYIPSSVPSIAESRLLSLLNIPVGDDFPWVFHGELRTYSLDEGLLQTNREIILRKARSFLSEFQSILTPLKAQVKSYHYNGNARPEGQPAFTPQRFPPVEGWLISKVLPLNKQKKSLYEKRKEVFRTCHKLETREQDSGKVRQVRESTFPAGLLPSRWNPSGGITDERGVYRLKEGTPLSSDEMANRIANELTHLPPYTARCLIAGVEYTMKAFPAPQSSSTEEREARERQAVSIWAASRVRYGRDRNQVEAAIAQRLRCGSPRATMNPDAKPNTNISGLASDNSDIRASEEI